MKNMQNYVAKKVSGQQLQSDLICVVPWAFSSHYILLRRFQIPKIIQSCSKRDDGATIDV